MSEPKFIRGPWLPDKELRYIEAGDVAIAEVVTIVSAPKRPNYEAMTANAHLIAAAPDLYAAVVDALEQFETLAKNPATNPWCKQMRAAIAKAKGGT